MSNIVTAAYEHWDEEIEREKEERAKHPIVDKAEEFTKRDSQIVVPRWFLEVLENTLRHQYEDDVMFKESYQSRNIRGALNGVRKLLNGKELTGMERLEPLTSL